MARPLWSRSRTGNGQRVVGLGLSSPHTERDAREYRKARERRELLKHDDPEAYRLAVIRRAQAHSTQSRRRTVPVSLAPVSLGDA